MTVATAVPQIKKSFKIARKEGCLDRRATMTVQNCKTVVILLASEGRISKGCEVQWRIMIPRQMITSRLMTTTASHPGRMFRMARVIKDEAVSSLSAAGSR